MNRGSCELTQLMMVGKLYYVCKGGDLNTRFIYSS